MLLERKAGAEGDKEAGKLALGEAIWLHDRGLKGPRAREGGGRLPLMMLVCPFLKGSGLHRAPHACRKQPQLLPSQGRIAVPSLTEPLTAIASCQNGP